MKQQKLDYSSKSLTVGNLTVLGGLSGSQVTALAQSIKTAQSKAQSVAADLSGTIKALADDGILTPVEKKSIKQELDAIAAEYPVIIEAAQEAELTEAEIAVYTASYDAIAAYVQATGLLDDMTANTAIDRDEFTAAFTNYYNDRLMFQNIIYIAQSKLIAREATVRLDVSVPSIARNRNGLLAPSSITVSGRHDDAIPFSGIFMIALSADGDDWQAAYMSSSPESSHEYAVPATIIVGSTPYYTAFVRVRLYADAEMTIRKGETILSVIADVSTVPYYFGARAAAPATGFMENDYYFDNRAPEDGGVIMYWTGSVWAEMTSTHVQYAGAVKTAIADMVAWCTAHSGTIGDVTAFVNAVINNLVARNAIIDYLATSTQVSTALCSDGTTRRSEIDWDAAIQNFRSPGQDKLMTLTDGYVSFLVDKLVKRRAFDLDGDAMRWSNYPDGGTKTSIASLARLGAGFDGVLMSGKWYAENTGTQWGSETVINAATTDYPNYIQLASGEFRIAYIRVNDHYLLERKSNGTSWGSETVINAAYSKYPNYIQLASGELRIAYQRYNDGYLVERKSNGTSWGSETVINAAGTDYPNYLQLASGELRIAYKRTNGYLVERKWNGTSWGSETVINAAISYYSDYIQLASGELRIAYKRMDGYLVERKSNGTSWGSETVINAAYSDYPNYIQLASGELRIAYQRYNDGYLVERKWNGTSWGSETVINAAYSDYPNYLQLASGELRIAYKRSDFYLVERTQGQFQQIGAGIIESGENSNGWWIKFGNGTMIEMQSILITIASGSISNNGIGSYGWSFYYGDGSWVFPVAFYASPIIASIAADSSPTVTVISSSSVSIRLRAIGTGNKQTLLIAIGQWKA